MVIMVGDARLPTAQSPFQPSVASKILVLFPFMIFSDGCAVKKYFCGMGIFVGGAGFGWQPPPDG